MQANEQMIMSVNKQVTGLREQLEELYQKVGGLLHGSLDAFLDHACVHSGAVRLAACPRIP